jgi:hypothetical protein
MIRHFIEIAAQATEIAGVLVIGGGCCSPPRATLSYGPATGLSATSAIATTSAAPSCDGRWPWQRDSVLHEAASSQVLPTSETVARCRSRFQRCSS